VPEILSARSWDEPIRVWSAGCASGQEAYSLAMVFAEAMGMERFVARVKIYATDIDEDALLTARRGYSEAELRSVPDALRATYFETMSGRHVFRAGLRRALIFGRHDLLADAPISRLDLLSCRNALMYFTSEAQTGVLTRFHYALKDDGVLFLGRAEMLLTHADLFSAVDLRQRSFGKVVRAPRRDRLLVLAQAGGHAMGDLVARQGRLRDTSRELGPVAQLVVDGDGALLMANREARTLLDLRLQDIGRPLRDLAVSRRPVELRSHLERARRERRKVVLDGVVHDRANGSPRWFDVHVIPLVDEGWAVLGCAVAFLDVTTSRRLRVDLERARHDLIAAHEELQAVVEQLQTTNEELQSAVEELETTNAELNSSGEELDATNQLLESANSQLQASNADLVQRTGELERLNAWLRAILATIQKIPERQ
jgi:two-component system CheB/CheR fusion protein